HPATHPPTPPHIDSRIIGQVEALTASARAGHRVDDWNLLTSFEFVLDLGEFFFFHLTRGLKSSRPARCQTKPAVDPVAQLPQLLSRHVLVIHVSLPQSRSSSAISARRHGTSQPTAPARAVR